MNILRSAKVFVRDSFAGILSETDEGYQFEYDNSYLSTEDASAVSLTLPLSDKPYTSKNLFPFFGADAPQYDRKKAFLVLGFGICCLKTQKPIKYDG